MSLLDNGPETVLVYPQVESVDEYGTPTLVPSDVPVEVTGATVEQVRADESAAEGGDTTTTYRVFARGAPAGPYAAAEWDGGRYEVVGEPDRPRRNVTVNHISILIREVSGRGLGESSTVQDGVSPG